MKDQKSLSLAKISYKEPQTKDAVSLVKSSDSLEQNYIIYRVKLNPIEVSVKGRDLVLSAMSANKGFIQLGDYTVMVNSISGIDPLPRLKKEKQEEKKQLLDKLEITKKKLGMI